MLASLEGERGSLADLLNELYSKDFSKVVPLTCHGHSRPVPHLSFSSSVDDDQYYLISACKGKRPTKFG